MGILVYAYVAALQDQLQVLRHFQGQSQVQHTAEVQMPGDQKVRGYLRGLQVHMQASVMY